MLFRIGVPLPLARDREYVVAERHLDVLPADPRKLDPDHQVFAPGEHVGVRDPGSWAGPGTVLYP
ncbi:MAG: hypothetical protein AVDCRST_MAG25-1513 [uncultured Rubrobacteraceae bacterium]|uniref:Uncharacterized protein n=1 Tax=uncultured Rubrobacteraceae bacterium TaxID=349277 RepID=A0A6J4R8G3_9ACTN|nr:MAG: hypothetical protein AVDCRST_MAG25-1513 [uncultured Rubrobacteraceae bacterium]